MPAGGVDKEKTMTHKPFCQCELEGTIIFLLSTEDSQNTHFVPKEHPFFFGRKDIPQTSNVKAVETRFHGLRFPQPFDCPHKAWHASQAMCVGFPLKTLLYFALFNLDRKDIFFSSKKM